MTDWKPPLRGDKEPKVRRFVNKDRAASEKAYAEAHGSTAQPPKPPPEPPRPPPPPPPPKAEADEERPKSRRR